MNAILIITAMLTLISGIGVFLIACNMLSTNLAVLGNNKIKKLFAKTTENKFVGVGVGTVATAAIQSSSATSVMIISFVDAGIISLSQAATIIFGANIGTTITAQIVAFGMLGNNALSASVIFSAFTGVGAFMLLFAQNQKCGKIGGVLAGFGMIFVGLSLMGGSMKNFAELEELKTFLAVIKHPLLLVIIGALLTAIIQSSSVMTSIAITMVVANLISLDQGIYLTMGSNVGTCATAIIAGMSGGYNAKRTALIHVIFNISGVIIFLVIGAFMGIGGISYGVLLEKIFTPAPHVQLAMFHTIFNIVTVILILPFTNLLIKLVTKIIPDKKKVIFER